MKAQVFQRALLLFKGAGSSEALSSQELTLLKSNSGLFFCSIHMLGFCVITIWEMEQALNGIKFIATIQNALEIQGTRNSRGESVADYLLRLLSCHFLKCVR